METISLGEEKQNQAREIDMPCHTMQCSGKPTIGVDHKTFAKTLWPIEKLQVVYAYHKSLFSCHDENEHNHILIPLTGEGEPSPKYYTTSKCWYFQLISERTNQSFGF